MADNESGNYIIIVILAMLAFLMWEIVICQDGEGHLALICAAIVAVVIAVANGWKWNYLEQGIIMAISRSMQAMLILMMVGLLIGSWIPGGVIPSLIYYGLMVLNPTIFLFAGCLLCCIVSLATGTSWGTAGTIGVALIGVGMGLGIDPAMTAGAIVSGAYFGDKMSPLSDTTNLAPAVAGSTLFDHIRHMCWTTGPSLLIALTVYLILGLKAGGDADMTYVTALMADIKSGFAVSIFYLLPPVFVIACVALKLARGTRGGLVFMTIFSCIFVNAVCCDQYLAIILPGRMYKESFEDMRLKPKNLSRCLEDAGTITSQFFPWNTCGATMKSFLGVNQWGAHGYGPYAILNWCNPIISIIYGFTGSSD